jgi:hypothetical protein
MNFLWTHTGLSIGRDHADAKIRKGSTVIYRALKALNCGMVRGDWVRFYPHRHGLTDCRLGIRNRLTGEVYWHERYQIEDAAEAWNAGNLFLLKA